MNKLLHSITEKHFVTAEDVLRLRREVFGDHLVDRHEAYQLFQLADSAPAGDHDWHDFLCEAATDFFVRQKDPCGYMTEADAVFLMKCFGAPETVSTIKTDVLCHMLKHATLVPRSLVEFGFEIVRAHVLADGRIDADEVNRLRCFLFAAGGDGNIAITRAEAELLFDINDLTHGEANAPAWTHFFAQGVANHLMAHIGYQPLNRAEVLRLEDNLADHSVNIGRFVSRMFSRGPAELPKQANKNRLREGEAAVAAQVTASEADWLADRIGRDGVYNDAEKAVIAHLKSLSGQLPPRLEELARSA